MSELTPFFAATAGGILPVLAWLWFWLREDSEHPEPRMLIALAFLAGMIAVAVAIPLEKGVQSWLEAVFVGTFFGTSIFVYSVWSAIEEAVKFVLAYAVVLRRSEDDEPIDPVIYLVTTALGFAGAENVLFLLSPISGGTVWQEILTGNLRFIGATLLHVLSSAVIGVALGLAFYKSKKSKVVAGTVGLVLAVGVHAAFNFLILNTPEDQMLKTFFMVWIGVIALLAVLEYIKRIHPRT